MWVQIKRRNEYTRWISVGASKSALTEESCGCAFLSEESEPLVGALGCPIGQSGITEDGAPGCSCTGGGRLRLIGGSETKRDESGNGTALFLILIDQNQDPRKKSRKNNKLMIFQRAAQISLLYFISLPLSLSIYISQPTLLQTNRKQIIQKKKETNVYMYIDT